MDYNVKLLQQFEQQKLEMTDCYRRCLVNNNKIDAEIIKEQMTHVDNEIHDIKSEMAKTYKFSSNN